MTTSKFAIIVAAALALPRKAYPLLLLLLQQAVQFPMQMSLNAVTASERSPALNPPRSTA
jgi:hypothetical protein